MSNPAILKQVYYPEDDTEVVAGKLDRLKYALRQKFPVEVVIKRKVKTRSPEASNYLWGICYPLMSDASGYDKDDLHAAMCRKWFGTKVIEVMGEKFSIPVRTTTLNEDGEREVLGAVDFWDFTDFVIREAAMWYDVAIPPPDPEMRK